MISIIQEMILDFHEIELHQSIQRRLQASAIPGKALVCIGVRRCGKSTWMLQLIEQLLEEGVARENILHLNFFDDRLHDLQQGSLSLVLEAYYSLYPEKKNKEKIYCFFDEIQMVSGWESFVDRLMRTEKCQVYITGSSAKMLSKEIATQMRGRALSWEMFPFSFQEFLDAEKIKSLMPLSAKGRLLIQKAFESYWRIGGFPEVLRLPDALRVKIHQEYFSSILFRDLVERHNDAHPKAIVDLAHWLMNHVGSLYSINNLTGYLKSLGHKAPKATVSNYLAWFEDAYFLYTVRIFDASLSRSNANPKKIYCVDHSLVTSISSGILVNSGHLLENLIFITLRRQTTEIFYYKTKTGKEVDFIIILNRKRYLIQVCDSLAEVATRNREIAALTDAMAELKQTRSFIVTRREEGVVNTDAGKITLLPAWRFLLESIDAL